ncbi:MAG: cytochrome b/b6 domain-containing protein [Burkholderiaceae bacterium]
MSTPPAASVRVWDLPTRLFHWTLATAVSGSLISAKIGGGAMAWHFWFGYAVFALLAFRILWGLMGGRWSRFASFIYAPGTVLRYLRGQSRSDEHVDVGHSPLGSFSVFALLAVLAAQVATGLVADDEISTVGPLNRLVSSDLALSATSWHKDFGQWAVFGLVGLHLAAIMFYVMVKKRTLVGPMVNGDKVLPAGTPASADGLANRSLAIILALLCAAVVAWVVRLGLAR